MIMAKEIENININGEDYEVSKIYAKMGLTFERFVELLERDFYCPRLTSDPTSATTSYTETDGEAHTFQNGQFAIVANSSAPSGYKVWQCLQNNGTSAVWSCDYEEMKGYVADLLAGKQNTIADLDTIRSGAAKGATALQNYTETDPVFSASAAAGIKSSDITNWNSKTSNTGTITGIKMNGASKGTSGVVDLGTVITEHQDISGKLDATTAASTYATKTELNAKGTYSKPSTGIPKTDLVSEVQTSLGKADTALQSHQDISGKINGDGNVLNLAVVSSMPSSPEAKTLYIII